MKLVSLGRITKLGLTNFWRNGWLSLVSSLILTITLFIICTLVISNLATHSATKNIEEKINLSIYLNDEASIEDINKLQETINKRVDVKSVEFISKKEALIRWQKLQITQNIKEQVTEGENPLPRSLEVKTKSPEDLESLAKFLSEGEFTNLIRSISYQQNRDIIQKLISITQFSQKIGLLISIVFIVISIIVILNTVRLAVFSRRQEIEIMKIVGASNYFIDFPFMVESFLTALLATIFSTLLIWFGLDYVSNTANKYLGEINLNLLTVFNSRLPLIMILELVLGFVICISCTLISLRKYLKV